MNFALILFVLVIVSGIAWVADRLYFAPQRRAAGIDRMPLWLEYSASFFPVICAVFVLRSFLVEPFKIINIFIIILTVLNGMEYNNVFLWFSQYFLEIKKHF